MGGWRPYPGLWMKSLDLNLVWMVSVSPGMAWPWKDERGIYGELVLCEYSKEPGIAQRSTKLLPARTVACSHTCVEPWRCERSDLTVLVGTECTRDHKELAWKYLKMLHPIATFSLLKFYYMHSIGWTTSQFLWEETFLRDVTTKENRDQSWSADQRLDGTSAKTHVTAKFTFLITFYLLFP